MEDHISHLLDELKQIKTALRMEMWDENPNPDTILACKQRIRALDSALDYYIIPKGA